MIRQDIIVTTTLCVCHCISTLQTIYQLQQFAVSWPATPLRELTCRTGSHSVTCHPAEVTFPPLPQPQLVLLLEVALCQGETVSVQAVVGWLSRRLAVGGAKWSSDACRRRAFCMLLLVEPCMQLALPAPTGDSVNSTDCISASIYQHPGSSGHL